MDIQKMNRASRLSEWAEMVSRCRNSGLTVATWCSENGISTKTYYYRLKHVCAAIPNESSRATSLPAPSEEPVFAELSPVERPAKKGAAITIRLGGVEIQIHNGAQPATIEATLRAVAGLC